MLLLKSLGWRTGQHGCGLFPLASIWVSLFAALAPSQNLKRQPVTPLFP